MTDATYTKRSPPLIGALKRLRALPCGVSPGFFAETAAPAALDALVSFLEPDPKELYHQIRGNSLLCDIKGGIKDAVDLPNPNKSLATRFFFDFASAFDLITWYTFLGDLGLDFMYAWSSQILKSDPCGLRTSPHYYTGNPFTQALAQDDGDWWSATEWLDQGHPGGEVVFEPSFTVPIGQTWFVQASIQARGVEGEPEPCAVRVVDTNSGEVFDQHEGEANDDGTFNPSIVVYDGPASDVAQNIKLEVMYTGGKPLPSHQILQNDSNWCSMYSPLG